MDMLAQSLGLAATLEQRFSIPDVKVQTTPFSVILS